MLGGSASEANYLYTSKTTSGHPMSDRFLYVRPVDANGFAHTAGSFGATVLVYEAGTTTRVHGSGIRSVGGGGSRHCQGGVYDVAFYVEDPAAAVDVEVRFPCTGVACGGAPVVVRSENVVPNDLSSDRIVEVERTA